MSTIREFSAKELAKWRIESTRAAAHLKKHRLAGLPDPMKIGFLFNDAVVTLEFKHSDVTTRNGPELATFIHDVVLEAAKQSAP